MILGKIGSQLRQTARQFKHKILPGTLILMYHRVAETDSDPWSLCVTPQHFSNILRFYGSMATHSIYNN